jgi:hypothetical protein
MGDPRHASPHASKSTSVERSSPCKWRPPLFLDWSETAITFDRDDHPDYVPNPGVYPLVVNPIIANTHLTKVLMDGGSSLNIIYTQTLDLLRIERTQL